MQRACTARLIPCIAALAALIVPLRSHAQVSLVARVSATSITLDGSVEYILSIRGVPPSAIDIPRPPQGENLTLAAPIPAARRQTYMAGGRTVQESEYRWTYRPIRAGTARFRELDIAAGGRSYRTAPIELTVVQRAAPITPPRAGPDGEPPQVTASPRDLFIRATASAERAYIGEQVVVAYRLFYRPGIQLRESRLADSWNTEGFWREELDVDPHPLPEEVTVGGLRYNSIVLKRVAVFPTRAGALQIDPLRIESKVYLPEEPSGSLYDDLGIGSGELRTVQVASPVVRIQGRALPPGAPASFSGAVGSFRIEARSDRTSLRVGDPLGLTVAVTGTGNIATLEPPSLAPTPAFERFDPKIETELARAGERLSGTRTFALVLVPRQEGTYHPGPVRFTWFDPQAGRYVTAGAELPAVQVLAAPGLAGTDTTRRESSEEPGAAGFWSRLKESGIYREPAVWVAVAGPLLALAGFALARRRRRHARKPAEAAPQARRPAASGASLVAARDALASGHTHAFYSVLESALLSAVAARTGAPARGLTHAEYVALAARSGVPAPAVEQLGTLLAASDYARYAPASVPQGQMQQHLEAAAALLPVLAAARPHTAAR